MSEALLLNCILAKPACAKPVPPIPIINGSRFIEQSMATVSRKIASGELPLVASSEVKQQSY